MLFLLPFFLLPSALTHAAPYKPGTVGYLYESCKSALESSQTIETFDQTYCGGFIEGYMVGVAANAATIPPPPADDVCFADKKAAFDHINKRFCANLPNYQTASLSDIQSIAPTAANIFFRWIEYLEEKSGKKALQKPVAQELNAMIGGGKFCNSLGAKKTAPVETPAMSEALKNFSVLSYIDIMRKKTLKDKYESCKRDYETSNVKTNPFRGTRCGAEITGFLAGILSGADAMATMPEPSKPCEKPIRRLTRALDVRETMCVSAKTNPATVAKKFMERAELLSAENDLSAMSGYGGAAYQPVFFGLMCR